MFLLIFSPAPACIACRTFADFDRAVPGLPRDPCRDRRLERQRQDIGTVQNGCTQSVRDVQGAAGGNADMDAPEDVKRDHAREAWDVDTS